jgi:hypothetical protein
VVAPLENSLSLASINNSGLIPSVRRWVARLPQLL